MSKKNAYKLGVFDMNVLNLALNNLISLNVLCHLIMLMRQVSAL